MPPTRPTVLALVLALLGLMSWWIYERQPAEGISTPQARVPDYLVIGFSVTLMGADGQPARRLSGQELRHFPQTRDNEIDAPRLSLYRAGEAPWRIRAPRGWADEDAEEIRLLGPVFIDRAARADQPPIHIKTYDLFLRTEEQYGRTEAPIHGTSRADWLSSARGGEVWFDTPMRVHLFGRVRQQFDLR